jgi:S1-C subfamily serine protease
MPVGPAEDAGSSQERFLSTFKAVSPVVVQARASPALGWGVVFGIRGEAGTNAHVVDDATRLAATLASGDGHPATLVGKDAGIDLAAIRNRSAIARRDICRDRPRGTRGAPAAVTRSTSHRWSSSSSAS